MKQIMIRLVVMLLVFTMVSSATRACDICGCGAGSSYIGILPEFGKKVFGIRYRNNTLLTHLGAGGIRTYLTTEERYRTADIWSGWNMGKKFRVIAYIPVSFNDKTSQGATMRKNGLGDISLQGYYQLLNTKTTISSKLLVQSLWIGGGVKLPSGNYEPADKNNSLQSANIFQLGTGSTDFSLNAMYDIRLHDVGINTALSYKINTANRHKYQYGNKLGANVQAYYKWRVKNKITIAPNAGLLYEHAATDREGKYEAGISGGSILLAAAGMETVCKRLSFGANWQPPLSQHLAGGMVKANSRMMIHISYIF